MHRKPVSLTAQHSVMDAVALFNQQGVSCIPVVNARCAPIGILSWRDIMRALDKSQTKETGG
ncbi:CBS domain-containing protein [Rheinheimera sp. 4Y26]|uniref:CBS domain-containing protein n=1 Tax=Rheinheimera sp. 4Y26 TaxID=2977811 RepID=UPI0021B0ED41|nr:CBS domain-containing protein [Rheinheimera sp. 4Y26]MCT6698154.1 CBS domain-containing protein [Rheinheimera sp. 4Y26]